MKIIHRIGINPNDQQRELLERLEIAIPVRDNPVSGFFAFELEENSHTYKILQPYIEKWELPDMVGTIFTNEEINSASLLVYNFSWYNGYPQPAGSFGYRGITYNDKNICRACGIGAIQQSPFKLKKAPNWGAHKMFELNWVFDEIFVRKEIYEAVFKNFGIQSMPVLLYKKETVIENTLQLIIPTTTALLNIEKVAFEICKECGKKKYSPQIRGFFPSLKETVKDLHMFKSHEYFGSGASAQKKIFITQELRQEMLRQNIKSGFVPVAS